MFSCNTGVVFASVVKQIRGKRWYKMVYETGILKKYKNFREGNFVKKTTLEHRRVKFCSPAKSNSLLIGSSSKRGVATGFLKKDSVRPINKQ